MAIESVGVVGAGPQAEILQGRSLGIARRLHQASPGLSMHGALEHGMQMRFNKRMKDDHHE